MSVSDLTRGSIDQMITHYDPSNKVDNPVLQILSIKKLAPSQPGNAERYRVILSDGVHYCQSMLAMQMKHLVDEGTIERHSLIRITDYAVNHVQSRKVLIILGLEKYADPTTERLGNPQNVEAAAGATTNGAAPAAPAAAATAGAGAGAGARAGATSNYKSESSARDVKPQYNKTSNASLSNSGAGGGAGPKSKLPIYPIEGLSPYQNKWTIRARVTSKGDVKHWSKPTSSGKLFSVNFLDESSEIRATGFGDEVDKFYNLLQEGKVYYISKAKVVIAKKQFSNLSNEYELQFKSDTEIEECTDTSNVPQVQYNFVPLNELDAVEPGQTCDVLGVITHNGELSEIVSKATGKPVPKRELTIADSSGMSVRVTLWGKTAENFRTDEEQPIIAFKGVKVGDFGGRSLSMHSGSTMSLNLEIDEAFALKGWYEAEGNKSNFKSYSNAGMGGGGGGQGGGPANSTLEDRKTVVEVKEEKLGSNDEKADWFTMKAVVVYVKPDTLFYTACPGEGCSKKVNMENGEWRCEKCDRSYPDCDHRYLLTANVADHTGQLWIQAFNDVGEQLLGVTANRLAQVRDQNESEAQTLIKKATGQAFVFNCRAKQETFNETTRTRYTVTKVATNDFVREGNLLAEAIQKYL